MIPLGDIRASTSKNGLWRRVLLATCLFCSTLISFESEGRAATANVPFTGTVLSVCALTVGTPGVMAPNANYTQLNSQNAGGSSGSVTAVTTGTGFSVTTEAPSNFTLSPTGGGANVTFTSSYSATGVTTVSLTAGTTVTPLNIGITDVSVHLSATKSTGSFPAGAYAAEVVIRCE
jgi:hypothetical protein